MALLRDQLQAAADQSKKGDEAVGLARNSPGIEFQCGTCQYFADGICHNEHPKLNGVEVDPEWCCNHYDHDGMETIIQ